MIHLNSNIAWISHGQLVHFSVESAFNISTLYTTKICEKLLFNFFAVLPVPFSPKVIVKSPLGQGSTETLSESSRGELSALL